ncbi:MAG: (Fe-S)-binding protein [Thermoplasmatota archaeon]
MKHLEEMKHELMCCTGCGYCKQHCQTLDIGGTETDSGRGRVFLAYGLLTGEITEDQSVVEALQRCPLCGRCEQDCPSTIPISDIIQTARRDLTAVLPAHRKMADDILDKGNPFGEQPVPTARPGEGEIAFFAGCVSTYQTPELKEAALSVLEKLDLEPVMVDEICCGSPLENMGRDNGQPPLLAERLAEAGVQTVLTSCPSAVLTLRETPRFTVQHLTAFLAEQNLELVPLDGVLMYHDSSVLGRKLGIYDPPRQLLQQAGGFREFTENRKLALCCGGDLAFQAAFPDMAGEMARQVMDEAGEQDAVVVTADPHCYRHLKEYGEVLDIIQVVDRCLQ